MSVEPPCEGQTRDAIFATLGVSVSTVKSHLADVSGVTGGGSQAASDTDFARSSSTPIVETRLSRRARRFSASSGYVG
uniref:Uncharacterized protein n=1 Tax=Bradyrhizobium ottawaense TaxID=931866 RepID=A0A2U8P2Y1_9BRAD|nr:hypothetical protein CIT37_07630 [Bradyrhizobium ottawaense]